MVSGAMLTEAGRGQARASIAYIIESLGSGGAEHQLVELIKHLDHQYFDIRVLTYASGDFFLPVLESLHVPVLSLMREGKWDLRPILQLIRWLRSGEVNLVHAYLSTPNLYAVVAGKLAGRGRVIVSERNHLQYHAGLFRLCGPWVYRNADRVVVNSDSARAALIAQLRLDGDRVIFIPNGVDIQRFSPVDDETRSTLRGMLGWLTSELIVLTVASYKDQKNHAGILEALENLDPIPSSIRCCWVGRPDPQDKFVQICERVSRSGLGAVVHMLGERSDAIDLYRACDVLLLNSLWEGTPNVVLEAMACGCPVIVTDVSDTGRYVIPGHTGWLIPPGDPAALRTALEEVAATGNDQLRQMGSQGRQHLLTLGMDTGDLARRHEEVYRSLMSDNIG